MDFRYEIRPYSIVDIRSRVVTALRWTVAARFVGQLVSWAITIVVIRILSPADYGLMAMAIVLMSLLYLVNDAGLDAVLIQKRDIDEQTRRQVFGVVILVNLSFFIALFLAAPLIALFFGEAALIPIIRVLALQFVLYIFETLPQTKLERELDFKRRSIVDLVTMLVGGLITLALALAGMGVWALVVGHLASVALRMTGLNIIAPCLVRPSFSFKGMKSSFRFGSVIVIDKALWYVFAESDKFIGGKLLGTELLGFYAVASHLASLPINKLAGLIKSVAFPAFSTVQTELEKARSYLLKAVRVMSVVAFPVFLGVSSVAPELIALFLGEKWSAAALPLQILGVVMPIRMISTLLPPVLWGTGRPLVSATNFLIAAIVMPVAFVFGARWGPAGLALAWLSAYPAVFLISVYRASRAVGFLVRDFIMAMVKPAAAAGFMYVAVASARPFITGGAANVLHLVELVVVGAIAYSGIMLVINRDALTETLELIRR